MTLLFFTLLLRKRHFICFRLLRLAVSAIGTCCKELLKSAEVVSTSWGARSTSDFCTASEILSFAEVFLPEIANNLMSGLYSFFLKLFLEQITELIMKYIALDMDGNEYFYLEHVADIGNPTAFVNSKRKVRCTRWNKISSYYNFDNIQLLTEMRSVRSFFYTAIKGKDWSSDFMSISRCSVVDKRRESNCNSDQFRVTDLDRSSNSQRVAKSDPLLNKSVGTDQNAGTQVKPGISFSRADASNMQRQVQNLHGAIEVIAGLVKLLWYFCSIASFCRRRTLPRPCSLRSVLRVIAKSLMNSGDSLRYSLVNVKLLLGTKLRLC